VQIITNTILRSWKLKKRRPRRPGELDEGAGDDDDEDDAVVKERKSGNLLRKICSLDYDHII
jgi:hypothetical protein